MAEINIDPAANADLCYREWGDQWPADNQTNFYKP